MPTAVNGKNLGAVELVLKLNELGGKHGIGIEDIVENRLVGMKSRGVYETPGGTILMEAHQQLEELVLDRATMETKKEMMTMTLLGQMLMEDGIEKGEFKNMRELIRDGLLSMETAAARKHMTVKEFKEKLKELNLE